MLTLQVCGQPEKNVAVVQKPKAWILELQLDPHSDAQTVDKLQTNLELTVQSRDVVAGVWLERHVTQDWELVVTLELLLLLLLMVLLLARRHCVMSLSWVWQEACADAERGLTTRRNKATTRKGSSDMFRNSLWCAREKATLELASLLVGTWQVQSALPMDPRCINTTKKWGR
jgi:C4-dicarboxylate-specific signal transduction histidine kinase